MLITHDLALGGLQQVVVNICRSINRDVFEPSVLCLRALGDHALEIQKLGIKVMLLPQIKDRVDYFSFLKVAKILESEKIDVIHTHNTQPFFDGTIGAILSGVKTRIHTDHSRTYPDKRRYMFAEWVLSHFVNKVIAVSQATAYDLIKYEKIPKSKVSVILNGVDGAAFSILIDKQAKRAELGITKTGPLIGICARLCKQKGITYMIKAIPKILQSFPECSLVIAGTGSLKDDLVKEAVSFHINEHVKFIGMRLDIPELLKLFDIYVLPSISEGLPLVILEAMAAQCPIVATNVGGIPGVIISEETGLLIEPGDPDAISKAIIKMLKDTILKNKVIKNAFNLFNQKFESGIMTKQYERLYQIK